MSKFNTFFGRDGIMKIIKEKGSAVHFVGVGGVGMYSVFLLAKKLGCKVSGSDRVAGEYFKKLENEGYDVYIGSRPIKEDTKLLVYSLAVPENDSELKEAELLGVPAVSRADMLGALMSHFEKSITVSGSHGKSTVTAMIGEIFTRAGCKPTVTCGASMRGGEAFLDGECEYIISEGCEYKDSFLCFSPCASVFTNLELDHTDYFSGIDDIKRSFLAAMDRGETVIYNADDANLSEISEKTKAKAVSFGLSENADFRAVKILGNGGKYSFSVLHRGEVLAKISLSVLGKFSVYNALSAFTLSYLMGIDKNTASAALSEFSGISRRLEKIGTHGGAPVIYDYAHHPSEIKEGILTLKESFDGKINVIFKPHTATRTKDLMDGFIEALSLADKVYISELDTIREKGIEGISSETLAKRIGDRACAISDSEIISEIKKTDGAILIMGAADLSYIKSAFEE